MTQPPVTIIFAEDEDFTSYFHEDFVPNLPKPSPEENKDIDNIQRSLQNKHHQDENIHQEKKVVHRSVTVKNPINGVLDQLPDMIMSSVVSYLCNVSRAVFATSLNGRATFLPREILNEIDFGELGQSLASRLTDNDVRGILKYINANMVKRIKLTHLTQITGSGLDILRGSSVLEHIDLSLVPEHQSASMYESRKSPRLSEDVVLPILDSIIKTNGSSLMYIQLPKLWREQQSEPLKQFMDRFDLYLKEQSFCCIECKKICQGGSVFSQNGVLHIRQGTTFVGRGKVLHNVCYCCMGRVGACCSRNTFKFCGICEKEYCHSCSPVIKCDADGCDMDICQRCRPIHCESCTTSFCSTVCAASSDWRISVCDCCKETLCTDCPHRGIIECEQCDKKNCLDCENVEGCVQYCGDCNTACCVDCRFTYVKEAEPAGGISCLRCKGMVFSKLFDEYTTHQYKLM